MYDRYQKKILNESICPSLTVQSQFILSSSEWLLSQADGKELDYSFAVINYFKILEIELFKRVFIPFKNNAVQYEKHLDLDNKHYTQSKLLNYYIYENKRISFGEGLIILSSLKNIFYGEDETNNLCNFKMFLKDNFPKSYFLYGKKKLANNINYLVENIRNPVVHSKNTSYEEFLSLKKELIGRIGKEGLIITFLKATTTQYKI